MTIFRHYPNKLLKISLFKSPYAERTDEAAPCSIIQLLIIKIIKYYFNEKNENLQYLKPSNLTTLLCILFILILRPLNAYNMGFSEIRRIIYFFEK